jgi:hypothetical protein
MNQTTGQMLRTILTTPLATAMCLLAVVHGAVRDAGASAEPVARLAQAQWIWDQDDTGESKHYVCCLRKTFTLAEEPLAATAWVTADNNYELHVNGTRVGSDVGDPKAHWQIIKKHDLVRLLHKGANAVVVRGINVGGQGGVVASVHVRFKGTPEPAALELVTDGTWRKCASPDEGFSLASLDDRRWKPADVIGPLGVEPWGWLDGGAEAAVRRTSPGPAEPPTRTLDAQEAQAVLEAEWLFQAEGKPLHQRAKQEIGWARAVVERLAKGGQAPDLSAQSAELDRLTTEIDSLPVVPDEERAKKLYLEVRRVKRQILFKDPVVDFSQMIFIDVPERYPHESMHRVYPQAQLNCVRLLVLDGLHPGGKVRKLTEALGPGWYWRPDLSFDARRVLFCFRPAKDRTFHLYEANLDGSGLRQLTSGNYDDQDPIYLPDGRIAFMSNRGNSYARCTVGHPSTVLARCDADGKNIYLLSAGGEPEYTPSLLSDGRILYTRWEYTDKELMRIQSLWTVNPDGTNTSVFWGNQSYWPDLLMEARPIPGSQRVMFGAHGHHEVYWGGVGILDRGKGFNYPNGLTKVTQELPWIEVGNGPDDRRETSDYHTSGQYGGYKSPYPLGDGVFLVSIRQGPPRQVFATRQLASRYKLFLMDVHGNRELIYEGAFHILYGAPVRPRPVPPVIPDQVAWAGAQKDGAAIVPGSFYSADLFQGAPYGLREKAKYLRVISLDPTTFTLGKKLQDVEHPGGHPHMHVGPVVSVTCNDGIKRILGTVPIQPDGSVYFEAPPCKSLHFQVLDDRQRCLHTMRSFTNVMPGERRGCVGCHETHSAAPAGKQGFTLQGPPAQLEPYFLGPQYSLGYQRDIQPILDKHCGRCHQGDGEGRKKLDLTLRPSPDFGTFPEPYVTLTLGKNRTLAGDFPGPCEGGIARTILAEAHPWRPADYGVLQPMTRLSYASPLIDIACSGRHHDIKVGEKDLLKLILWVDTLCPYRGEQEIRAMADPDPNQPLFRRSDYPPSDVTVEDVYAQSPYRPRMRTAPLVDRAYRQDEFPNLESRLPRDARGSAIPPVSFTADGRRVEVPWPLRAEPRMSLSAGRD